MSFFPFPRTPHLEGSSVVDDDKSESLSSVRQLLKEPGVRVVIQEKVDGTNVSVHFEQPWVAVPQKRSGLILNKEHQQYQMFNAWVMENLELLWERLGTEHVLFGEWVWCRHGVAYDRLPAFFVAFDVYEKSSGTWLAQEKVRELCGPQITCVPLLYAGEELPQDGGFLKGLIKRSSFSSSETAEGVYVRLEKDGVVTHRAKLRRDTFESGREDFRTKVVRNELAAE